MSTLATGLIIFAFYAAFVVLAYLVALSPGSVTYLRRPRPRNRRRHNLARFLSVSPQLWTSRRH